MSLYIKTMHLRNDVVETTHFRTNVNVIDLEEYYRDNIFEITSLK